MEALDFGIIIRDLEAKIEKMKEEFSVYLNKGSDYSKLTIEQYNHLINMSKVFQSEMDKFVQAELYHIIGMGHLTPYQSFTLCQKVESYLSFRNDIKFFAMQHPIQFKNKKIESTYELSAGVTLKSKK